MKLFRLTCDEATAICDKTQYNEGTLVEKIKLNLHFLHCKFCRLYSKQNTLISLIINKNKQSLCQKNQKFLSKSEKETLKKNLKTQME